MPAISLVVCLHGEREMFARLLRESSGCYDDLVVVHDGPEDVDLAQSIERLATSHRGRFFIRPRAFQQEPHWPFAWEQAAHDWILRLDADEFPSEEMRQWLARFRRAPEPAEEISGYTCIWPLWNGRREISKNYSPGRIFFFHRQRVRFFGMVEQVPIADGRYESLNLVLHHQPRRKSYGFHSMLCRERGNAWRRLIAQSLLGKPRDLNCWRWQDENWPPTWEEIRRRPLRTALRRLFKSPLRNLRDQWKHEHKFFPVAALTGPLHHTLMCLAFWRARRSHLAGDMPRSTSKCDTGTR
jgi:hypothetical protein